ncbi:MAG: acireductone synthase [Spirochaetia bacterium]|nr:acireductone synthase [Spirochaetia bacterium]
MISAILTDIEGTISPIAFVKETLFPYARRHLSDYLQKHQNSKAVREIILETGNIIGNTLTLEKAVPVLTRWIDEDKKYTPLKTLQGLIWEQGFRNNIFTSQIYSDSLKKLQEWKNDGIPVYVYSSGSIFAQNLFFKYSNVGDISSVFDGYFDTTTGSKKEKSSYQKIAEKITVKEPNILFLSDIAEELDAAAEAGMKTILVNREEKKITGNHKSFSSFENIDLISL